MNTIPPLPAIRPTRHEQLIAAELLALKKSNESQDAKLNELEAKYESLLYDVTWIVKFLCQTNLQ